MAPAIVPPPNATRKASLRSRRCSSRQGSSLMRGISVKTPQREATSGEQRGCIALYGLGLCARGKLHWPEGIAFFRRDADAARDHIRSTGDIGAAAAHQNFLRLFA